MKTKKKPELISLAELSRRAGVNPASVTEFVKKNEAAGLITVFPEGRRGKRVDCNNALIKNYIQGRSQRSGAERATAAPIDDQLRKMRAQIKALKLKKVRLGAEYVERAAALEFLESFYEFNKLFLSDMAKRIKRKIDKECGPLPPAAMKQIDETFHESITSCLESVRREIDDLEKATAPQV